MAESSNPEPCPICKEDIDNGSKVSTIGQKGANGINAASGVVANKQELERSKISVWCYFHNVSIKIHLHNVNLYVKMLGIHNLHKSIQS